MEKTIEKLIENGQIKDLVRLPDADFNKALEIIRRKHFEALGFRYADEHTPGYCESCGS